MCDAYLTYMWVTHFLCYTFCVHGVHMGKNVTLRLDQAIIRKARHAAVEQDQSLSEWVADLIVRETSKKGQSLSAREQALKRMDRGFHLGGAPLTRAQSHER